MGVQRSWQAKKFEPIPGIAQFHPILICVPTQLLPHESGQQRQSVVHGEEAPFSVKTGG